MKTNQTPPHTINQGSIIGDGSGNTINNGLSSRAVVGIALLILMAIAVAFYISNKKEQPKSSLAYHFLVDVSENMNQTINGISLYGIAKQVIHNLSSFGGFDTSRTLRGLRFVGGGDSCNQTSFVGLGTDVSPDKLTHALNQVSPSGVNAYELGLSEAFTDLAKVDANIKIIFIMLGSVSNAPCREYSLPIMLRSYIGSEQDITPIICTFAIVEDDLAFENFKRQMIADGFSCVYQSSDPNDITQVAIDIIEGLILGERQEKEFIISPPPPTEIIYLAPTSTAQSTTIAEASMPITDTPAPTDTEIPITPTNTEIATNTPHPTDTQTAIPSETATPTATETITPTNTEVATNTPHPTDTQTAIPSETTTPTTMPTVTNTPSPTETIVVPYSTMSPDNVRNSFSINQQVRVRVPRQVRVYLQPSIIGGTHGIADSGYLNTMDIIFIIGDPEWGRICYNCFPDHGYFWPIIVTTYQIYPREGWIYDGHLESVD